MSKQLLCRCDECGLIKGETNHWWAVMGSAEQPRFSTAAIAEQEGYGSFRLDYCGQQCVTTVFNRWLSWGSVLKQAVPPPEAPQVEEDRPLVCALNAEPRAEEAA